MIANPTNQECGKSVKHLANHFRKNCSGKPEEEHSCNQCVKTFKKKEKLKRHIRCVHEKIKNLHCTLCQYKTYSNSNLRLVLALISTSVIVFVNICIKLLAPLSMLISL